MEPMCWVRAEDMARMSEGARRASELIFHLNQSLARERCRADELERRLEWLVIDSKRAPLNCWTAANAWRGADFTLAAVRACAPEQDVPDLVQDATPDATPDAAPAISPYAAPERESRPVYKRPPRTPSPTHVPAASSPPARSSSSPPRAPRPAKRTARAVPAKAKAKTRAAPEAEPARPPPEECTAKTCKKLFKWLSERGWEDKGTSEVWTRLVVASNGAQLLQKMRVTNAGNPREDVIRARALEATKLEAEAEDFFLACNA